MKVKQAIEWLGGFDPEDDIAISVLTLGNLDDENLTDAQLLEVLARLQFRMDDSWYSQWDVEHVIEEYLEEQGPTEGGAS